MKTKPDDSINVYDRDKKTFSGGPTKGLTKREHFAAMAMAMQGLLGHYGSDGKEPYEDCGRTAIFFADALIKELNKRSDG